MYVLTWQGWQYVAFVVNDYAAVSWIGAQVLLCEQTLYRRN